MPALLIPCRSQHCPFRKYPNHLPPILRRQRRRGKRSGNLRCQVAHRGGQLFVHCLSRQQLAGALYQQRSGIDRRDGQSCICDVAVRSLHNHGDAGQGIVDRSADPQLAVHAAVVSRRCRQKYASQQLIRSQVAIRDAVTGIEVGSAACAGYRMRCEVRLRPRGKAEQAECPRKKPPSICSRRERRGKDRRLS